MLIKFRDLSYYDYNINYFYLEDINIIIVILRIWVILMMLICDFKILRIFSKNLFFFLLGFLFYSFIVDSLLIFFFYFEISLVPMFFIIFINGKREERLKAIFYILLYTLVGSFPLLIIICKLKIDGVRMNFFFLKYNNLNLKGLFVIMFLVFFIKLPIYGLHLWLPKAHVEASVRGSIILAGLILKLGGYGVYRLIFIFVNSCLMRIVMLLCSLLILGSLFICCKCIILYDLKMIIAYSSISHIRIMILRLLTRRYIGLKGFFFLILAHGLCSRCLFFLVNLFYERIGSRNLFLLSGLGVNFPVLIYWIMLFIFFNVGVPPSINFIRELFVMGRIIKLRFINLVFLILLFLLSGVFRLFIFTRLNHGKIWNKNYVNNLYLNENLIIFFHFLPLIIYILILYIFECLISLNKNSKL